MHPVDESRYSRQIKLPQVGLEGQQKITAAKVLIIGMGGLGSPAALYLAAAGVGEMRLSDFDVVEESNLQRQVIHAHNNIGQLKTHSAADTIKRNNPQCRVVTIDHEMDEARLADEISAVDIVLDCSDNFATRFAVNRQCVSLRKPLVSAAAVRLSGQIMSYIPEAGVPCYQCVYSAEYETAVTCESEGILGPVVGVLGTMQALQALLILIGKSEAMQGQLLLFDALHMHWQSVQIPCKPDCPACSGKR